MNFENLDAERRRQKALTRLGHRNPRCVVCGEDFPKCLEAHHLGKRAHDETTTFACLNCHQKLSDKQLDYPRAVVGSSAQDQQIAYFLLGIADLFELLVAKLKEFGRYLLAEDRSSKAREDRP